MTKSNTEQHQNMSKTRHQNGTKKKQHFFPNAVRSLLYIRFVAVAFQLWRSNPLEKGPHWPIMALPWIHHCADLAQQSIQICGSHEYSQMLVDNCYAFSLLLQHSNLKEKFFGEGAPHWRIMALLWICPLADLAQKWIQMSGVLSTLSLQSLVNIHKVIL